MFFIEQKKGQPTIQETQAHKILKAICEKISTEDFQFPYSSGIEENQEKARAAVYVRTSMEEILQLWTVFGNQAHGVDEQGNIYFPTPDEFGFWRISVIRGSDKQQLVGTRTVLKEGHYPVKQEYFEAILDADQGLTGFLFRDLENDWCLSTFSFLKPFKT